MGPAIRQIKKNFSMQTCTYGGHWNQFQQTKIAHNLYMRNMEMFVPSSSNSVKVVPNIPYFQDHKALLQKNFDSWTLNNGAPYVWPEKEEKKAQWKHVITWAPLKYLSHMRSKLHHVYIPLSADLQSIHFCLLEQSTDSPGRNIYGWPQVIQHCLRASLFQQPHLLSQCGELVGCYPVLNLACLN